MSGNPFRDVDLPGFKIINVHLIARKEIRKYRQITVGGKVISYQLAVGEDTKHITKD